MSRAPAGSARSTRRRNFAPRKRISPMAGSARSPRKSSGERLALPALAGAAMLAALNGTAAPVPPYTIVGDAIPAPLTDAPGDAARGRAIVVNRQVGLCLLCHSGPFPEEKLQGSLAPSLAGAGARSSLGQ